MSVSHPLLKELKVHILQLVESPKPIRDEDENLSPFCECLEKIFSRGVLPLKNAIGFFRTPECWYWIEQMASDKFGAPYSYESSVVKIKKCKKVSTNRGRMRLFIRTALVKRCLHAPVEIIMNENRLLTYYKSHYILGDEILAEMFLSILKLLGRLEFKLDLNKSRFLDETWVLPNSHYFQLVPCRKLGISVMFVESKAVIYYIAPFSVASETEDITLGDILDDLNGIHITDQVQGALGNIIRKAQGRPITAHIIKAEFKGNIFPPMIPLLSQAGLDPASIAASFSKELTQKKNRVESLVTYMGVVDTGERGDVKEISKAVTKLLNEGPKESIPVIFDYHDLDLKLINAETQEEIMKHSYLAISSCGCTNSIPCYFAFISGQHLRDQLKEKGPPYGDCKDFKCYIFHCTSQSEIESLLRNIAHGFKRTHCAA